MIMPDQNELRENEKTPEGANSDSLRLNIDSIPQFRQILLDLLSEYREFDFPANPDLLKLHIDAATDRLEALVQAEILVARKDLGNKISHMVEDFRSFHDPDDLYMAIQAELTKEEE